jgi:peptide/nickel transport system ATP-binding protein
MPILKVEGLTTYYKTLRGYVKAAEDVNFELEKGKAIGLAGESGCGKTTVALSILKILPMNGEIVKGKILFKEEDIVPLSENEFREKIRWKGISIVFQGAMNALNPVYTIEDQIVEAIGIHEKKVTRREAVKRAEKLFELVGVEPSRLRNYPHEFSGGMRQRALIAMSLACNPDVVITDEPGTALDVIIAAQVFKLMKELKDRLNLAMIMITHDLSIIAELCESSLIMYAGRGVEFADTVSVFKKPLHPYTQGLIEAFPSIKSERKKLTSIPGQPPNLLNPPLGCRFNPRCKYAMTTCKAEVPVFKEVSTGHYVACHLYG